jgi:hypothetical protein
VFNQPEQIAILIQHTFFFSFPSRAVQLFSWTARVLFMGLDVAKADIINVV